MKVTYILELSPQEFRLISAALQCKLKEEWKAEAAELQNRLFQERNKVVKTQLGNIAKMEGEDAAT